MKILTLPTSFVRFLLVYIYMVLSTSSYIELQQYIYIHDIIYNTHYYIHIASFSFTCV